MKTLNPKTVFAVIAILFAASVAKAQTPVHCCTTIEVTDGTYTDKLWMITEPGTTDGFDNGWDGYKFLSSASYVPQVYDNTADGTFQVSSFPTIENNSFAFRAGSATEYKMTFTHYDVSFFYKGLYLIDLVAGDTIDVYANLSTYKFSASKTDMVDRFKFITKLPDPVVVVPPVVVEPPVDKPDEDIVVDPGVEPDSTVIIVDDTKNKKFKKEKKNKAKDVKVKAYRKRIHIENPNATKAKIKVIEARSGKVVKEITVNPGSTTTIDTNVKAGQYVIQTQVDSDYTSTTVLLQ